ncbi:universal stress protein [Nitrosovibrio tenuis]|uniref:Universal stress protein n=1 Tax=Nitrosovibrio tenuis TaxID=1233 RepID=A0A1H7JTU6_9PROT|nr:universal stress protein [Nitrosovibrio tenuis]SEK78151.1 Nucleotide-binding universal stress protein, UspA family [Nitrosovibrio tenuis]
MYRHILVPVDGSATSEHALQEALGLARQLMAKLELVYVMEEILFLENEAYINYAEVQRSARSSGEKILAQAQALVRQASMTAEQKLLETRGERIASIIIEEARRWGADLIVIGTHGRSGFSRILFGSVAEGVVRTAHIPVLLVRGG